MGSEAILIRDLLAHMGVSAEVQIDANNEKLIIIETAEYYRRRGWIESWFTLIEQDEQNSFFRERPRGTGTTMV